jgi:alpha-tubulin suppressor-like RCC1 family protein
VQVNGLDGVVSVIAGDHHSLAVKGDGSVWGWGSDRDGQLGDGTWYYIYDTPIQLWLIDVIGFK